MKNPAGAKNKIKIIADECVDKAHIDFLFELGYDVKTTGDFHLLGSSNGTLLKFTVQRQRVFLTEDRDFSNILIYPPHNHHGIILLKSNSFTAAKVHSVLKKLLTDLNAGDFDKTLIIVDKDKYRIRRE